MKLYVTVSDFGAAANIGGSVGVATKEFELPENIANYIESNLGKWTTVTLSYEDIKDCKNDR
jgi:hypothetical protein